MLFEDALPLLRSGTKITHPCFDKDEYIMACYITLLEEPLKFAKKRGMSLAKMQGEHLHSEMRPEINLDCRNCHIPGIPFGLIMDDRWEIYNVI